MIFMSHAPSNAVCITQAFISNAHGLHLSGAGTLSGSYAAHCIMGFNSLYYYATSLLPHKYILRSTALEKAIYFEPHSIGRVDVMNPVGISSS